MNSTHYAFYRIALLCLCLPVHIEGKSTVFFSPDDHPKNELIVLLDSAHKKIHAAVYMITDYQIAHALVEAHKRGIEVEIVTDCSCKRSSSGKINKLISQGIPVYVYDPSLNPTSKYPPLMHDKFAIIDDKTIWTGSFNWTYSASVRNEENALIITDEPDLCTRFAEQFIVLKDRCVAPVVLTKNHQEENGSWHGSFIEHIYELCSFLLQMPT